MYILHICIQVYKMYIQSIQYTRTCTRNVYIYIYTRTLFILVYTEQNKYLESEPYQQGEAQRGLPPPIKGSVPPLPSRVYG